jgi:phage-related protein
MPHIAYKCEIWHNAFAKPVFWMGGSREDVGRFPETAQDSLGFELYRVQCGFDPKDWKPMTGIGTGVKEIRVRDEAVIFPNDLSRGASRRGVCVALFPEEVPKDKPFGFGSSDETIRSDCKVKL